MNSLLLALLLIAPVAGEVAPPSGVRPSGSPHHHFVAVPPLSHRGCDVPQGDYLPDNTSTAQPRPRTASLPADSPAWPEVRGPFSWADRVMNSTTIARSGGIYALRAKTLEIYTPLVDVDLHFCPKMTEAQGLEPGLQAFSADFDGRPPVATADSPHTLQLARPLPLDFFSYALGSKLYEDAAALLFSPGVFAPSDTLQYLRGVTAYDIHDFSLAADCFAAVPEGSPYAVKAKSFLDVWNSTPEIPNYKPKSPWLAGAMSAVIPGSGKIYAGDLRSGVSTLLIVGALGGMAAESWIKLGGRDWRTIALSSVFGLFYIGNIYGSALSVSVIRNTYQDAEKATLLFDLRIPLHQF